MNTEAFSPPQPPVCLTRSYQSREFRGGTVIAEDVLDPETHAQRLIDPDVYRECVKPCWRCGSERLHAHCFRDRKLRPGRPSELEPIEDVTVRLYRCAEEPCRAVFTVLPAFIARHLWRAWSTVQGVLANERPAPRLTVCRWRERLRSDASQLTQIFATLAGSEVQECLAQDRPPIRESWLRCLKPFLASVHDTYALAAAWIHRLSPGIRLM